jgi:hypothetical protein
VSHSLSLQESDTSSLSAPGLANTSSHDLLQTHTKLLSICSHVELDVVVRCDNELHFSRIWPRQLRRQLRLYFVVRTINPVNRPFRHLFVLSTCEPVQATSSGTQVQCVLHSNSEAGE